MIRSTLVLLALLTGLTGVVYPVAMTAIAQLVFPGRANGSLIQVNGEAVGSSLIGQPFDAPRYFWSRPSGTGPFPYNAASSSGTNQGPTNPALTDAVKARIAALRAADPANAGAVPADLVTASGSGLDPHISPAAAEFQVARVARARGLPAEGVRKLAAAHTQGRTLWILGEPRVNVLELNLSLDGMR